MREFHYRIGRQFGIYPWLININGGASLKQPVWTGDVAAAIRLYCEHPEQYAGKTMELAGPEVMQWTQIVEWFKEVTHTKKDLPRTPTSLARLYAGFLELGPTPYISRSDVDLRVTDCILDPHTTCITFKDLGVRYIDWRVIRRLNLTQFKIKATALLCVIEREVTGLTMWRTQI